MGLDTSKLQNLKHRGDKIVAQCPACAQEGHDHTGNHLFICGDGRFGCVLYPGECGISHRKKIFELIGIKEHGGPREINIIPVHKKNLEVPEIVESHILGRLGRLQLSLERIKMGDENPRPSVNKSHLSSKKTVPNVPRGAEGTFSLAELELIQYLDEDT